MTMDALNIEIEELTPEQAAEIWQEQSKRPANFPQIVIYLRAKAVGQAFDVKVDADPARNEQHAKDIRKWFGVAARERTVFNGDGTEVAAPVRINWREQSHKAKQVVVKDGKRGEVEITIIDRLHGKVLDVSTNSGRGRKAGDTEQVDDIVKTLTFAAGSKTIELPDGRKAKLTRSGHWRAPKSAATASSPGEVTPNSHNGTADGAEAAAANTTAEKVGAA